MTPREIHARCQQVMDHWNEYAQNPDQQWTRLLRVPPKGETHRLLCARVKDDWWFEHYQDAMKRLAGINWYKSSGRRFRIISFLRAEAVDNILSGAWDDKDRGGDDDLPMGS